MERISENHLPSEKFGEISLCSCAYCRFIFEKRINLILIWRSLDADTILFVLSFLSRVLCLWLQCSWGSKPTPPGTASNPLPPPAVPAPLPGLSANDLLAYERQIAMSKMGGGVHTLMHPQGQHPLKQAAMGMGAGASQAIYDGGFQNVAAAQQLMYYQ